MLKRKHPSNYYTVLLPKMGALYGSCNVFVGCMLNAAFLELVVKADPGSGTLVTFAQFAFIALHGFIFTMKFGTVKRHIPLQSYFAVVTMFFLANVCNNYAFYFNVSMPLHMTFRSGSLITNMIMAVFILKRSYSFSKYASVLLISLGVLICTLVTGQEIKSSSEAAGADDSFFWWLLGIAVLVFALLVSSLLGIYQEMLFKKYGKHPYEALFYTHTIPLPIFLLFHHNILEHLSVAWNSEPLAITSTIQVPSLLLYILGNVGTQYLCISSVYYLTTEANTLTVTLVLTLRKFLSLIISVLLFKNDFSIYHWIGTLLVLIGTVIFTELHKQLGLVKTDKGKKSE